jgi:hypothetical protein
VKKSLLKVRENMNVRCIIIFMGCVGLMSLFGAGCGTMTSHPPLPQIRQIGWQGAMENLNQESFVFYPQTDVSRFFGSARQFADPFQQNVTDVFTPTISAIESQTQKITLSVVVKVPSGSYTLTVADVSNNKTALYLSIPDQQGVLKTSHVPFCYVWGTRWGQGNRSFSAVIDYTVSDQIRWL